MTLKQKWENYWYYHKVHTIVGVLAALFVLLTVSECVNRVEPDFSVVYAGAHYVVAEGFEDDIAVMTGDLNGDGQNHVFFDKIIMPLQPESDMDMQMAQKLLLSFVDRSARLYIIDRDSMIIYGDSFEPIDGILPQDVLESGLDFEGRKIGFPVSKSAFLTEHGFADTGEELYAGILMMNPDDIKKSGMDVQFDTSVKILKLLAQ